MVWGCFSWYGPLVSVQGKLKAVGYEIILDNFSHPTLCQQFGDGPFLFQYDNIPVHKAVSIQVSINDVEVELDGSAQSLYVNPIGISLG